MKNVLEIVPYGGISSRLTKDRWQLMAERTRISTFGNKPHPPRQCVFVSFSQDVDDPFVEWFRKKATQNARLLIFNEGVSTDTLLSRFVKMQIRSTERFYVADCTGLGKTHGMAMVWSVLRRLASAGETDQSHCRILDARIEKDILHVVSLDFARLDIPLVQIPEMKNLAHSRIQEFEIDEDGAFIYWPEADLHLGWSQLQQLVNPEAVLKASQKSLEFNRRYGRAVRKVREQASLKPNDIAGLSEKQLRRIESGDCRLTSNAIEILSSAHQLTPNQYMKRLAEALD